MYFNGNVTFKNISSGSLGITVSSMPKVNHSQVKATEYDIPERDGIQYSLWRNRTDATIVVSFAIIKSSNSAYITALRSVRQWLSGTGTLVLDNNPNVYYVVKKVEITDDTQHTVSAGEIEATFTVEPFEYLLNSTTITKSYQGSDSGTSETVQVTNSGDICKPLVTIQFINSSEQIVGNITLTLNVDTGSNVTFTTMEHKNRPYFMSDTNLMYTWRQNADASSTSPCEDNFTTHNYDDLWVPHGTHDIKLTKTLTNIPGYYKISINLREGYAI